MYSIGTTLASGRWQGNHAQPRLRQQFMTNFHPYVGNVWVTVLMKLTPALISQP